MASAEVSKPDTQFGGVNPIFRVNNVAASTGYYVNVLGFKVNFQTPGFASVSRDRCNIFLVEGDQGHPGTWVWIGTGNVEVLCAQLRAQGAKIRHEPTNYPWALEMQVEDLDGNVLRIGSEPKKDVPRGEWLDMHGTRWRPLADGGWERVER